MGKTTESVPVSSFREPDTANRDAPALSVSTARTIKGKERRELLRLLKSHPCRGQSVQGGCERGDCPPRSEVWTASEALLHADLAMYEAKRRGGAHHVYLPDCAQSPTADSLT